MLQTQTIEPGTLSLLKKLMEIPHLQSFSLVGGTALALKFGHRLSVDLDLFSYEKFDLSIIEKTLIDDFNKNIELEKNLQTNALYCFINGIKVDVLYYPHPIVGKIHNYSGIRILSDKDIAAMKIQAILGRGRKKDFWDIYQLLKVYDLKDVIAWHKEKFFNQNLAISIPNALSYFADADSDIDPVCLNGLTWDQVKNGIMRSVRNYL